jgi:hypothetical protein
MRMSEMTRAGGGVAARMLRAAAIGAARLRETWRRQAERARSVRFAALSGGERRRRGERDGAKAMTGGGGSLQVWRAAIQQWRRTGDVSRLAEVAAEEGPDRRSALLDAIRATSLRNDVEGLLRRRESGLAASPVAEAAGGGGWTIR